MQCKLKTKCPNQSAQLYNCWDDDCKGWMHQKCSALLMDSASIAPNDRPKEGDVNGVGEPVVFCKKGCLNKWLATKKREAKAAAKAAAAAEAAKKKKKVTWEEDGSMDVLMEWITTEGNYAEYCGATGNGGKTKTQHHKDLAWLIKREKPETDRSEKDVENKIVSLERQFRIATDWANNTGQDD